MTDEPIGTPDYQRLPTKAEMKSRLSLLLAAFPTQERVNPEQAAAAYAMALADIPYAALHVTIIKLMRGEYPDDHDGKWLPTCAVVSRIARREAGSGLIGRDAEYRRKLAHWVRTGDWPGVWGAHPETHVFGVECPSHILQEFGLRDRFLGKPQ